MTKLITKELVVYDEKELYIIKAKPETQSGGADATILGSGNTPDRAMNDLKLTTQELIGELNRLLSSIDVWFQMPDEQRFAVLEESDE